MTAARQYHTQQVHYLRKTVNFNDANVATGVKVGTLPAGTAILDAVVHVQVGFNAGTTNVLEFGVTGAAFNDISGSGSSDITEATPGVYRVLPTNFRRVDQIAAETDVFAKYTQTGGAATAGKATINIAFTVDNDL
jgi:hypothetical protein